MGVASSHAQTAADEGGGLPSCSQEVPKGWGINTGVTISYEFIVINSQTKKIY